MLPSGETAAAFGGDAGLERACQRLQRLRDLYALVHLVADVLAGLAFTVGSVLFFWPATESPAIWLFVVGSVLFTARPAVRLGHTLHDRRRRHTLERELSAEARARLAAFDPRGRFLRT